jgi:lysine 6-dehydrogenase
MSMKVLVLGCGFIGSVIAADLAERMPSAEIFIADKNLSRAFETAKATGRTAVRGMKLDAQNHNELVKALRDCDVIVGAMPGDIGHRSVKAAVEAEVDMVDVSYMPENPLDLNGDAEKAGITIVPDCGVAPGISNVLIGHSISQLDMVEGVYVMVGGLPERPIPPLAYTITWSSEGLIDEYTRTAKIVKKGKLADVEALTGLETVEFPGVGKLEAFYTDGLRTLVQTVKGVENMWEKTLRYPGHAAKIRLLKALGFFDDKPLKVDGESVSPRRFTARLLEATLRRPDIPDILALKVEVQGQRAQERKRFIYYLLDRSDQTRRVSAMARTTAYPASILAQIIARGDIKARGVIPLEKLCTDEKLYERIVKELKKRRIAIVSQTMSQELRRGHGKVYQLKD